VGLLACINQVDIALEMRWSALGDTVERTEEVLRIETARLEQTLHLPRMRDHAANSFWLKGGWQNLEQGYFFSGELVDLTWFRGEVGGNELPKFLGGVRLVHLFNGVIDSYGVFATG